MNSYKEYSMRQCLIDEGLPDLPKLHKEENGFWIKAVALVKKFPFHQTYMLVEHRADGYIKFCKDYPPFGQITGLLEVRPYMYLDEKAMDACKGYSRDLIALRYPERADDIYSCDADRLSIWQLQYAIDVQKDGDNGYEYAKDDHVPEEEYEGLAMDTDEGKIPVVEVVDLNKHKKINKGKRNGKKED